MPMKHMGLVFHAFCIPCWRGAAGATPLRLKLNSLFSPQGVFSLSAQFKAVPPFNPLHGDNEQNNMILRPA